MISPIQSHFFSIPAPPWPTGRGTGIGSSLPSVWGPTRTYRLEEKREICYSYYMKLLIFSDTHGNYPMAIRAIDQAGHFDGIIHLGDEIEDACIIEQMIGHPVIKVPGNCDHGATAPRDLCRTMADKCVFLTHGDRYGVKNGLAHLHKKALKERAHIVLYGHSHLAAIETIDGIIFINPGCLHRSCTAPSYAVMNIISGTVSAKIIPVIASSAP